jgi:IQ domain-containing protein H|tara:strand:+ start:314 stop:991 length:678 start_codon:yes stop_codon:yes gene_type:complete
MSTALVPVLEHQSPRGAGTLPAIEGGETKPSGVQLALPASRHQGIQEDGGAMVLAGPDGGKSKDPNAQARGYNELMDEYSLHQLMFRKGKLIDQTPEFVSFRRTYIDKWGPVSFILMNFEKLFTDHDVALAYVDGRQLVELARENLEKPTKEELFDCINNKEAVGKLVKIPTRMFKGPEGPILAATVIQKNFRMYKAREAYKHLRFLMKKATIIQRRFRLYLFQK